MVEQTTAVDLAERVAQIAADLHIETALIGAYALAAHGYVRATADIDLGACVELDGLRQLKRAVEEHGLATELVTPDDQDPLGGVLRVWEQTDETGIPLEPVEVVNFLNSHRPRRTPAREAIHHAIALDEKPALRYPSLAHLIALKLYAGSLKDDADVLELLLVNADADVDAIQKTCKRYGLDRIDDLIAAAAAQRHRS